MNDTQKNILDDLLDQLRKIDGDVDVEQGSYSHMMASLMAYLIDSQNKIFEGLEEKLNLTTENYDLLKMIASPRIGDPLAATTGTYEYEVITEGATVPIDAVFIYPTNNQKTYRVLSDTQLTSTTEGSSSNLKVGETLVMSGQNDTIIKITKVITLGSDPETIESYRQRYLSSLLVDQQPGLPSYYKNLIAAHEYISICGVNLAESKNNQVYIYVLDQDYEMIPKDKLTELQTYFQENYTPIPQVLMFHNFEKTLVDISLTFLLKEGATITEEIVRPVLIEYQERFNRELANTNNLQKVLEKNDLFTKIGDQMRNNGSLTEITINKANNNLTFSKQTLSWNKITIHTGGTT